MHSTNSTAHSYFLLLLEKTRSVFTSFFRPTSDLTKYIQKKPKSSEISHFIRKSMNLELLFVWKIIVSSNNHNNISVLPCFANNIHQWKSKASQDLSAKLLSLLYLWSQKKKQRLIFFVKTLCERKNSFLYQKWTLCWHQLNMSRRHIVNRKSKFLLITLLLTKWL